MSNKVKRLYKDFKPNDYKLDISISEDKKNFQGKVTVTGQKTSRPSKKITLHQKCLKIIHVTLSHTDKKGNKKEINISRINKQESFDELRIHTENDIYPGQYEVIIEFTGSITKNMDGIYPCVFEKDGKENRLIATQFESHHAREVFPCIDEPEAKATFQLNLTHDKDEIALSNTEVIEKTINKDRKTTHFAKTPIMSTYLLAFVVGNIKYKQAKSKSGVLIRTYATPDQVKNTDFALDVAVKSMDYYEEYYDIPFPLQKCDFVALPDFASGAMENWGLITFREQTLLVDEKTSISTKQYVAIVVAHELTHQWFGNLVTMRWWTDLWLNEGFASWMEYLAIDNLFPEWKLWTQFAVDEQQLALKMDALENTHPIEVPVKHPDEIRTIFDVISYQKGASVIHMLNDYLGADGFRDGLRHYLKEHAYKNTDTIDLWQALESSTKKPVKDFMHQWTSQSGFPILEVSKVNDHLKITQSKFVANPKSKARNDNTLWPIPLLTKDLGVALINKKTTNAPFSNKISPVKLNMGQTGFYRVNYSNEMQKTQIKELKNGKLNDIDRMGLLSDSFEVTKAGYQPVTEYLELLANYDKENSLPVWEIIAGSIGAIKNTLSKNSEDNTLRDAINPMVQKITASQIKRLTWEESPKEPYLDTLLRPIIVGLSAGSDDETSVNEALTRYNNAVNNNQPVNPNLRGIIYSTTARKGNIKEYEQLLNMYKNTSSSDEKLSLTAALTSFEQEELHRKTFDLIKSDTVRLQDISYWIVYSFMNRHSRNMTWDWLKENWQWLKANVGTDLSFSRTPLYAARNFASDEFLKDYTEFFEKNMEPMLKRSYIQGIEIVETNIEWRKRDADKALKWFKNVS